MAVLDDVARVARASPGELHDVRDRVELRDRYYNLLSELRVVLPGVQVLSAFLLAAAFAPGFEQLSAPERFAYFVGLLSSVLATVLFITPAAFHRSAGGRVRVSRLVWSVRTTVGGLVLLVLALLSTLFCVTSFVYGTAAALAAVGVVAVAVLVLWVMVPFMVRRTHE